MRLRKDLRAVVDILLASSEVRREITLDAVGEAIGVRAVTAQEIDDVLKALEARGRKITSPEGGTGEARLKAVVSAARALGPELGRAATVAEIATRSGLTPDEVRHALALAKVMQH